MLKAFPENPLEPWHAVFTGDSEKDIHLAYKTAQSYGKSIVDVGMAKGYLIVFNINTVHCIPIDDLSKKQGFTDYYVRIILTQNEQ